MPFPEDFYQHLREHSLTGIKGGPDRETFLEIWFVQVDGRVFARSWNKSKRSWFTAFQETGVGAIQYGDNILQVTGKQLPENPELNQRIDQAYLARFTEPANIPYAQGIAQLEYHSYTMEFFV